MKTNLRALSARDLKPILSHIKEQWGAEIDLPVAWYQSTKNDLFVVSKDITKIDARKLRINSVGLYIGELKKGLLRLNIEGSQLIGPKATKNVVELNDNEMRAWLRGEDLDKEVSADGYVIIKHGDDFAGCGRIKEKKILNFVPKARRLLTRDAQPAQQDAFQDS
jgi:NOL1/NOP2/fmu family ribosome biogenesis protein